MFWVKKHTDLNGMLLVAACDDGILGGMYEDGEYVLEVTKSYFGGEQVNEAELADLSDRAGVLHFVGEKVTEFAKTKQLIEQQNVKAVHGVPFAMCVRAMD